MHSYRFVCALLLLALHASHVQAEELWGVAAGNQLINFSSSDPSVCEGRPITGLATGESIVGIDYRPEPPLMRLYALADTGQLYLINDPASGVATPVQPGPPLMLKGPWFGIDFDPVEDHLRVVSDAEQNLRVDADTGDLVATDGAIAYAPGDQNAGMDPIIAAAAYTNNFDGSSSSTLYAIDSRLSVLVTGSSTGNGIIATVGSLGTAAGAINGFDISGVTDAAYVAVSGIGFETSLCTVNLKTGIATSVGLIGCGGGPLGGLSVANFLTPITPSTWGLTKSQFSN
jgi:hypothetical protein